MIRRKVLAVKTLSRKCLSFLLYGVLVVLACSVATFAQGVPCSEAKIDYYSPTPDRAKHLSMTAATQGTFDETKKVESQLGQNHWLATVESDYTKNPPWNSTVFIGNRGSDRPFLKISLIDHGSSLTVRWVTDRLLLVEVWWGRFGMSDWLIDVERRKVVYDELLNYYAQYSCTGHGKETGR